MNQRISDDILALDLAKVGKCLEFSGDEADDYVLDLRDSRAAHAKDRDQMDRLTSYMLVNFPAWNPGESAADVAVRHLARLQGDVERLKGLIENHKEGVK